MAKVKIKIIIAILAIAPFLFLSGCGKPTQTPYATSLIIWGIFDSQDAFGDIIKEYKVLNPRVKNITYRKVSSNPSEYKDEIVKAIARGDYPDIFLIDHNWLDYFKQNQFIEPAPAGILAESEFRNNFVDVVADDFINEGKIYALPLSVDSIGLYYNKDIFNSEGIVFPPANWDEFSKAVQKFTKIDEFGNITQSGAALGLQDEQGGGNINRATDILAMLMIQKGAEMAKGNSANFDRIVEINGVKKAAGVEAFDYYMSFSRSNSNNYSWNSRMHNSKDSFAEGNLAMMLNYSWAYSEIKNKNAKLNFAVAPVPQFSDGKTANYANYWGFAVAKKKNAADKIQIPEAWQFLKFLTIRNNGKFSVTDFLSNVKTERSVKIDPAKNYLEKTGKPAARRDIIEEQKNDVYLGPFAAGNIIAKTWRQAEPEENEKILSEAIKSVVTGDATTASALSTASAKITAAQSKK